MIVLDSFNYESLKILFAAKQSRIDPVAIQKPHIAMFFEKNEKWDTGYFDTDFHPK